MAYKSDEIARESVARRAYEIWLARGNGSNGALSDWLEAERQLSATAQDSGAPSSDPVDPKALPADPKKQGCAVSFLTRERDELDEACGELQPDPREEYVQPEREKEAGGES